MRRILDNVLQIKTSKPHLSTLFPRGESAQGAPLLFTRAARMARGPAAGPAPDGLRMQTHRDEFPYRGPRAPDDDPSFTRHVAVRVPGARGATQSPSPSRSPSPFATPSSGAGPPGHSAAPSTHAPRAYPPRQRHAPAPADPRGATSCAPHATQLALAGPG